MQEVFKDKDIQQLLVTNGYAVVPVLDETDIAALREYYNSVERTEAKGTHVTMFNPSYEYRCAVDKQIKHVCAAKIAAMLNDYRALYANYMIKESGPEGEFPVHQDWTYVDESKFVSIAFWIPLQDVNEDNGALHVVKGSHKFITKLRGPYVHEPFQKLSDVIKEKYAEPIKLKAGEALVWDHRLIHFSKPNKTNVPRIAVTLIMVPDAASVVHCYAVPESMGTQVQKYEVDTDFYMRYVIGQAPVGVNLLETVTQPMLSNTESQFEAMYSAAQQNPVKL